MNENSDSIWPAPNKFISGRFFVYKFIERDVPNLGLAKGLPGSGFVIAHLLPALLITDALIAFILFRR